MIQKKAWGVLILLCFFVSPLAHAVVYSKTKAPDFSETDIRGTRYSLDQYRGRRLVLYFWATWCPACRADVPKIEEIYRKYKVEDIGFIAVSLDVDLDRLEEFAEDHHLSFPILFSGKTWDNEISTAYKVFTTPSYILVDRDGLIEGRGSWARDLEEDLETFLQN